MVDEVTSIDVPELLAIGEAVTGVASRLDRVTGAASDEKLTARDAAAGSVTCASALPGAAAHWRDTLAGLVAEIRDYGSDLQRAAVDYRTADAQAAGRFRLTDATGRPVPQ